MTSRIQKRLLLPKRVRHPPREGFSWVDRRFLKDYAARLSRDAILLYFFFSAASDQHGLSFYSDATIALRLKLTEKAICDARAELVTLDLIAWQRPLTQVLSSPEGTLFMTPRKMSRLFRCRKVLFTNKLRDLPVWQPG